MCLLKVVMSFKKLGSLSQEVAVEYARNDGSFVVFIEDANWAPRLEVDNEISIENGTYPVTPQTAFYDRVLRSMGVLLKLRLTKPGLGYESNFFCGHTSVTMSTVETLTRKHIVNVPTLDVGYVPTATLNLSKIVEGGYLYQSHVAGSEACKYTNVTSP
jgi:hypothetical protein